MRKPELHLIIFILPLAVLITMSCALSNAAEKLIGGRQTTPTPLFNLPVDPGSLAKTAEALLGEGGAESMLKTVQAQATGFLGDEGVSSLLKTAQAEITAALGEDGAGPFLGTLQALLTATPDPQDAIKDLPIPADAEDLNAFAGQIYFTSRQKPEQLFDFYESELTAQGWTITNSYKPLNLEASRGEEKLILTLAGQNEKTMVLINRF